MVRVAVTVAFLVVPLVEIFIIISIGQVIGGWQTVGLLVAMSVLGTYLVRREGSAAWRELQRALGTGRIPSRELADAALVLVGGTLLLTPGFLTDVLGFFLILPLTRPLARRLLTAIVARRLPVVTVMGLSGLGSAPAGQGDRTGGRGSRSSPGGPGPAGGSGPGSGSGQDSGSGPGSGSGWRPGGRIVAGEVVHDDSESQTPPSDNRPRQPGNPGI